MIGIDQEWINEMLKGPRYMEFNERPGSTRQMDRILFVYKCECGIWWTAYAGQPLRCSMCGSKERDHVATIDPSVIITRALNGTEKLLDVILDVDTGRREEMVEERQGLSADEVLQLRDDRRIGRGE